MIGCDCHVCRSSDPHDRRSRPSILIQLTGTGAAADSPVANATRTILVDTSTDLRQQALTYDVRRVDAILFTHSHADHVLGLDEVRRYNHLQHEAIPAFADERTSADLRRSFAYIFDPETPSAGGIPQIGLNRLAGPFSLGGVEIVPVPILHGQRQILGFRFGSFAYLTDCSAIPDASWPLLAGVQTLIIDALRRRPHPTHFSVSQAVEAAGRIGAARTYLTHICHDLGHAETGAGLPAGVQLAYDGLVLEIA
jgi:phosphoribosyl 1,2-cyclic phosphate phosphodiesterase